MEVFNLHGSLKLTKGDLTKQFKTIKDGAEALKVKLTNLKGGTGALSTAFSDKGVKTAKQYADALKAPIAQARKLETQMKKTATKMTIGMSAPLAAMVTGIIASGKSFEEATSIVRVGTGATGKALEELMGVYRGVNKLVPESAKVVANATADLNTLLGLEGEALGSMSKTMLDLNRIIKGDISTTVKTQARLFGDWGVATDKQTDTLDYLFKTSQTTGIGVNDLSSKLVQFGAPLRQLGFDLETAAVMFGRFEKEGVNTEVVLGSMRIALGKFANAGITDVPAELERVIESIKNAGTAGEANTLAMETFGAKAGSDMAATIREGRLELDDYLALVEGSPETISKAATAALTFEQQMAQLTKSLKDVLAPLGVDIINAFKSLLPYLERGVDWLGKTVDKFAALPAPVKGVTGVMVALGIALPPLLIGLASLIGAFTTIVPVALAAFGALAPFILPAGVIVGGAVAIGLLAKRMGVFQTSLDEVKTATGELTEVQRIAIEVAQSLTGVVSKEQLLGKLEMLAGNLKGDAKQAFIIWAQQAIASAETAAGAVDQVFTNLLQRIVDAKRVALQTSQEILADELKKNQKLQETGKFARYANNVRGNDNIANAENELRQAQNRVENKRGHVGAGSMKRLEDKVVEAQAEVDRLKAQAAATNGVGEVLDSVGRYQRTEAVAAQKLSEAIAKQSPPEEIARLTAMLEGIRNARDGQYGELAEALGNDDLSSTLQGMAQEVAAQSDDLARLETLLDSGEGAGNTFFEQLKNAEGATGVLEQVTTSAETATDALNALGDAGDADGLGDVEDAAGGAADALNNLGDAGGTGDTGGAAAMSAEFAELGEQVKTTQGTLTSLKDSLTESLNTGEGLGKVFADLETAEAALTQLESQYASMDLTGVTAERKAAQAEAIAGARASVDQQREILDNYIEYEFKAGRMSATDYIANLELRTQGLEAHTTEWESVQAKIDGARAQSAVEIQDMGAAQLKLMGIQLQMNDVQAGGVPAMEEISRKYAQQRLELDETGKAAGKTAEEMAALHAQLNATEAFEKAQEQTRADKELFEAKLKLMGVQRDLSDVMVGGATPAQEITRKYSDLKRQLTELGKEAQLTVPQMDAVMAQLANAEGHEQAQLLLDAEKELIAAQQELMGVTRDLNDTVAGGATPAQEVTRKYDALREKVNQLGEDSELSADEVNKALRNIDATEAFEQLELTRKASEDLKDAQGELAGIQRDLTDTMAGGATPAQEITRKYEDLRDEVNQLGEDSKLSADELNAALSAIDASEAFEQLELTRKKAEELAEAGAELSGMQRDLTDTMAGGATPAQELVRKYDELKVELTELGEKAGKTAEEMSDIYSQLDTAKAVEQAELQAKADEKVTAAKVKLMSAQRNLSDVLAGGATPAQEITREYLDLRAQMNELATEAGLTSDEVAALHAQLANAESAEQAALQLEADKKVLESKQKLMLAQRSLSDTIVGGATPAQEITRKYSELRVQMTELGKAANLTEADMAAVYAQLDNAKAAENAALQLVADEKLLEGKKALAAMSLQMTDTIAGGATESEQVTRRYAEMRLELEKTGIEAGKTKAQMAEYYAQLENAEGAEQAALQLKADEEVIKAKRSLMAVQRQLSDTIVGGSTPVQDITRKYVTLRAELKELAVDAKQTQTELDAALNQAALAESAEKAALETQRIKDQTAAKDKLVLAQRGLTDTIRGGVSPAEEISRKYADLKAQLTELGTEAGLTKADMEALMTQLADTEAVEQAARQLEADEKLMASKDKLVLAQRDLSDVLAGGVSDSDAITRKYATLREELETLAGEAKVTAVEMMALSYQIQLAESLEQKKLALQADKDLIAAQGELALIQRGLSDTLAGGVEPAEAITRKYEGLRANIVKLGEDSELTAKEVKEALNQLNFTEAVEQTQAQIDADNDLMESKRTLADATRSLSDTIAGGATPAQEIDRKYAALRETLKTMGEDAGKTAEQMALVYAQLEQAKGVEQADAQAVADKKVTDAKEALAQMALQLNDTLADGATTSQELDRKYAALRETMTTLGTEAGLTTEDMQKFYDLLDSGKAAEADKEIADGKRDLLAIQTQLTDTMLGGVSPAEAVTRKYVLLRAELNELAVQSKLTGAELATALAEADLTEAIEQARVVAEADKKVMDAKRELIGIQLQLSDTQAGGTDPADALTRRYAALRETITKLGTAAGLTKDEIAAYHAELAASEAVQQADVQAKADEKVLTAKQALIRIQRDLTDTQAGGATEAENIGRKYEDLAADIEKLGKEANLTAEELAAYQAQLSSTEAIEQAEAENKAAMEVLTVKRQMISIQRGLNDTIAGGVSPVEEIGRKYVELRVQLVEMAAKAELSQEAFTELFENLDAAQAAEETKLLETAQKSLAKVQQDLTDTQNGGVTPADAITRKYEALRKTTTKLAQDAELPIEKMKLLNAEIDKAETVEKAKIAWKSFADDALRPTGDMLLELSGLIVEVGTAMGGELSDGAQLASQVMNVAGNSVNTIADNYEKMGDKAFSATNMMGAIGSAAQSSSNVAIKALGGLVSATAKLATGDVIGAVIGFVTTAITWITDLFNQGRKRAEEARAYAVSLYQLQVEQGLISKEQQHKYLQDKLAATKKGTQEEIQARRELWQFEKKQAEESAAAIKKLLDSQREYAIKTGELTTASQIQQINYRLENTRRGSQEEIDLLSQRYDLEQQLISDQLSTADSLMKEFAAGTAGNNNSYIQGLTNRVHELYAELQAAAAAGNTALVGTLTAELNHTSELMNVYGQHFNNAASFLGGSFETGLFNGVVGMDFGGSRANMRAKFDEYIVKQVIEMAVQMSGVTEILAEQMALMPQMIQKALESGDWSGVSKEIESIKNRVLGKFDNLLGELAPILPKTVGNLTPLRKLSFPDLYKVPKPKAPPKVSTTRNNNQGTVISEITGDSRKALEDLLRPLATLNTIPFWLERIYDAIGGGGLNFTAGAVIPTSSNQALLGARPPRDDVQGNTGRGDNVFYGAVFHTDARTSRELYDDIGLETEKDLLAKNGRPS